MMRLLKPEDLKDYLKWNGYDVYRDTKKHYRILDTYGINRKDWDIMKDINKDEGGVGKYFEGAEDDHSLFQKRIIPTLVKSCIEPNIKRTILWKFSRVRQVLRRTCLFS